MRANITIRDTSNPVYQAWANMKKRCLNSNYPQYSDYGGRGIKICDRWIEFDGFLEDMGPYWKEELELDRVDNSRNYTPSNCRWADKTLSNQNRRIKSSSSSYTGVRWHNRDKKWEAHISIHNQTKYTGYFDSEEKAAKAYDIKAIEQYGPECKLNFPLIRIRDDDVLMDSSRWPGDKAFERFKQIHEWICEVPETLIHVPTILVTEIQQFPKCIDYIREETKQRRMLPEIHGLKHIDYASLTRLEVINHLKICKEFIFTKFDRVPRFFMTPWGAGADERGAHLKEAAESVGLEMVTCEHINKVRGKNGAIERLRTGGGLKKYGGCELFTHWYQDGRRIKTIVDFIKTGVYYE